MTDAPRVLTLLGGKDRLDASNLWRCIWPSEELTRQGYVADWAYTDDDGSIPHRLVQLPGGGLVPVDPLAYAVLKQGYTAIMLDRLSWPEEHLAEARVWLNGFRRRGICVLGCWDDDAWLTIDEHLTSEEERDQLARNQASRSTLDLIDGVIVSTQRLATTVRTLTDRPVAVVPNLIDLRWFRAVQAGARRVVPPLTIGWAGARRQEADLLPVAEAWGRVAKRAPHVRFVVQGFASQALAAAVPPDRLFPIPWMDLSAYPIGLINVDIGCCSVADTRFNRNKCVVGNTLVSTEFGLLPIKSLVQHSIPGIITPRNIDVLTTEGWAMTTYGYAGGEVETIRITTERGFSVEGTVDHRIRRSNDEWARLDALALGDEVRIEPMQFAKEPLRLPINAWAVRQRHEIDMAATSLPSVTIDENWGRILGYIMGDGHIGRNAVRVTCDAQDADVATDLMDTFRHLGLNPTTLKASGQRQCVDVSVASARFNDFLWALGMHQDKRKFFAVPDAIMQSPKPVVAAFLQALFEADGMANTAGSQVVFTTKSLRFATEVHLLLTGFGIAARLSATFNTKYQKHYYYVRLGRAACDVFAKEIGFRGERKQTALKALVQKPHSNRYQPMCWSDPVVKIERGRGEVFDLTVPGPTEYVGNGFVNHNSPIKALEAGARGRTAVVATPTLYGEVIKDGDTGFLAETADEWEEALMRLVEDAALRRALARRLGRAVEERYSLQRWAGLWLEAWDKLITAWQEREKGKVQLWTPGRVA